MRLTDVLLIIGVMLVGFLYRRSLLRHSYEKPNEQVETENRRPDELFDERRKTG